MNYLPVLQLGSPLSYLLAFLLPALDAILPIVPSETAVVALGVATAASTDPRIAVLVLLAALGAFLGDNLSYLLGRHFGPAVNRRFFSDEKGSKRQAWAARSLDRYGARLIVLCRFLPGGRTAVTLSCGLLRYHHRRFMAATAVAGLLWASYAFFVGRLGGKAFESRPWAGFLFSFGTIFALSALVELLRRGLGWWQRSRAKQRP